MAGAVDRVVPGIDESEASGSAPDWRDRLAALPSARSGPFQRMTLLAQQHFDVAISCLTIIDAGQHAHVAAVGIEPGALLDSVCPIAMRSEGIFVATDLSTDPTFAASAPVAGRPHLRFYASVPLQGLDGAPVGTFCIMDTAPRGFTRQQADDLLDLGHWAQRELEDYLTR